MSNRAWVTLATNDSYGIGALVLAHSLRRAGSTYPAVVLITPSVTEAMRERLRAVFAEVVIVDVLDSRDAAHLALLQRPELGITFTKIHCWNLTQYEKCVFLDADTLVIQNCDELFEREQLSAAPDVGWPDCFNSGVFVYTPSTETFDQLIAFAQERGSFDGGDQGLLNSFFSDWAHGDINKHLPFLYNVTSAAFYSYLPALKQFGQNLKIIHFIGAAKPWLQQFNWESRTVEAPEHLRELLQIWWDLFVGQVHSQLDTSMVEVEETPPALPPQDVSQHHHYQPILDPESEFPWHHPDAQIVIEYREHKIDMSEFHDPWDIYIGHIPPISEDRTSHISDLGRLEDQEELRKYAWEYQSQEHVQERVQESHVQYSCSDQHIHDYQSHQDSYQQQHCQLVQHYNHGQHSEHHWPYVSPHEHGQDQQSSHSLHEQTTKHHDHWHQEQQTQDHSHHHQHDKEHSIHTQDHYDHNHDHDQYHQHSQTRYPQNHHEQSSQSQYHNHSHGSSSHAHPEYISHVNETFKQHERLHDHANQGDNHSDSQNLPLAKHQELEVNRVDIEIDMSHNAGSRKMSQNDIDKEIHGLMNGDISESEDEPFVEEVRPRHPYDGFYLRHRMTIDSYGRKICTHEIPPAPSCTPSPSDSPTPSDSVTAESSDYEDQSGVAGNLARVVPGAPPQGEALDELTRRQGWEAGNIDYMGADSFDNIWAKISQTLNQPRSSPPKELSSTEPAQPEPISEQVGEIVQEPLTGPVEVATEAVSEETVAPVVVSVPVETSALVATPTPADLPAPAEAASATEASTPVDTPALIEAPIPVQSPAIVEAPTPVEAPVPVAKGLASVEASEPIPAEAPAPIIESTPVVETVPPVESAPTAELLPVVESVPVEECAPVVESAPVAKSAPVVESAPVVKSAPVLKSPPVVESTPIVESAPVVESASVVESTPVVESASVVESTPVVESAPAVKSAPVAKSASVLESAPAEISVPVEAPCESIPVPAPQKAVTAESPKEKIETPVSTQPTETSTLVEPQKESAPEVVEASKAADPILVTPASPVHSTEAPASPDAPHVTPQKPEAAVSLAASDSPPLANTPSKEEAPAVPVAKSEERRKPAGKLQLRPPAAADPLPTPDSELEDAATLAQSIIASELRAPTVSSPSTPAAPASPPQPAPQKRLTVEEPQVPTPPVGAVSLAQIGVKPKPTTAARIESSVTEKAEPAPPADAPKKKVVRKVIKKEGASGAEAPVPPPRKKEKKPKEK